jgi:hypothetical protein
MAVVGVDSAAVGAAVAAAVAAGAAADGASRKIFLPDEPWAL